ncbi:ABC transporter ATP-binding protein [Nonomuraea jiangxiensis]|uniref:Putative ABC transport system ATP-binding protein n=1 Tax=Nonomuraea jiangxiensis TaxID=633440 RepID=A0A1G9I863_9ACTN|nr:ABC transporter ATP-binding protein [Nonomuraea jiangxiensis]SDL20993.1 putative ABC transport system ATP-binding protein [Nonomuraea jiangxiensis]
MSVVLEVRDAWKVYPGNPPVESVRGVSFTVERGELVAIVGPSGSGKTTILNMAAGLDRPTSGSIRIAGRAAHGLSDRRLSGLRAHHMGVVFQRFHLLDHLSALDNVATGLLYRAIPGGRRRAAAAEALERVGLGHRAHHRPHELSGGEQQRVAIARAVVGRPELVFADEPTGNLDTGSGAGVLALLDELNGDGTTIVVITHSEEVARAGRRHIEMRDGQIVHDSRSSG